jgi:hypothetical protein
MQGIKLLLLGMLERYSCLAKRFCGLGFSPDDRRGTLVIETLHMCIKASKGYGIAVSHACLTCFSSLGAHLEW